MKRLNLFTSLLLAAIFFFTDSSAQGGYIKIGDIKGESVEAKHRDWIIIQSFSQGVSRQTSGATGAGRARSSATMQEFIVTKNIDMSSPKLMEAAVKGQIIPEVTLDLTASNRNSFYTVKMTNVLISSFSNSGACSSQCEVTEQVTFNFEKITWTYVDSRGGTTTSSYNVDKGM